MTDNRAPMASAILNAMLEANALPDGTIIMNPDHCKEALIMALAAMLEAEPDIITPLDMKKATKTVEEELRGKLVAMRASYEKTGKRLFDVDVIRTN